MNISIAAVKALRDAAYAQVKQYPQYTRERFDDYFPVLCKKTVKTKLGIAVKQGEIVLSQLEQWFEGEKLVTFWSFRNAVDTSVSWSNFEHMGIEF